MNKGGTTIIDHKGLSAYIFQWNRKRCMEWNVLNHKMNEIIPYIGNFPRREILAKMMLGRYV